MIRIRPTRVLLVLVLLSSACTPIAYLPGTRLGGSERPTPDSWSGVEIPDEVFLRTEGSVFPRVVTIWAAKKDDVIYVVGAKDSGWVKRALVEPNVELRVDDDVYALRANPTTDDRELERVTDAFMTKYSEGMRELYGDNPPSPEERRASSVVFRLVPR